MKSSAGPKNYGTFADFEREEIRPMNKLGFCVDDLESEAGYKQYDEGSDYESEELNFGR
jgi:hypothetical protein